MKRLLIIFTFLFFSAMMLASCVPENEDILDPYDEVGEINILNDEVIYLDELSNLDIEIIATYNNELNDNKLNFSIKQDKEFIRVDGSKILINENTSDNYKFTVVANLKENSAIQKNKTFIVKKTRGIILGTKQVSQVVLTVKGDLSSSRGISWFTSKDVTESDVLVSTDIEFENVMRFKGYRQSFDAYEKIDDNERGVDKKTFYNHQADIVGLKAGTKYYYKVGSESMNLFSLVGSFETIKSEGVKKIFLSSDIHVGSLEQPIDERRYFNAALKDAFSKNNNIDLIISTGDSVSQWKPGYKYFEDEWARFMNLSSFMRESTYVPISGNHDNRSTNQSFDYVYPNHFNIPKSPKEINDGQIHGPNYSFDIGNVQIIILNNHLDGLITKNQELWLNKILKESNQQFKIVFSHMKLNYEQRYILEENNVILAFSGHNHYYRRTKPLCNNIVQEINLDEYVKTGHLTNQKGTTYVTNGSTGGAADWKSFTLDPVIDFDGFRIDSQIGTLGKLEAGWGMYSMLTIDDNKLTIDVYVRNSVSALDDFHLYDTYGFIIE